MNVCICMYGMAWHRFLPTLLSHFHLTITNPTSWTKYIYRTACRIYRYFIDPIRNSFIIYIPIPILFEFGFKHACTCFIY